MGLRKNVENIHLFLVLCLLGFLGQSNDKTSIYRPFLYGLSVQTVKKLAILTKRPCQQEKPWDHCEVNSLGVWVMISKHGENLRGKTERNLSWNIDREVLQEIITYFLLKFWKFLVWGNHTVANKPVMGYLG